MITCIDETIKSGKVVRALVYENASELTGNTLITGNAGEVECEVGALAFKAGFKDMKQLNSAGSWVTVGD